MVFEALWRRQGTRRNRDAGGLPSHLNPLPPPPRIHPCPLPRARSASPPSTPAPAPPPGVNGRTSPVEHTARVNVSKLLQCST